MTITPQTNTMLEAIAEALLAHDDFCICGHVSPDGDCLGSQLALAAALRKAGKRVSCLLARQEPIDVAFSFLPGADELVPAADFEGPCETFVAVDVPTPARLGDAAAVQERAAFTITIDHHAVDEAMSDLSYTDPDAASTTMLIWRTIEAMNVGIDAAIATCTYTGLMTDTGSFQHQNADAEAFELGARMVAAGADPATIAQQVCQNRSVASLELQRLAIERMRLLDEGAIVLSWIRRADMEELGAVKSDAEPLIDVLRSLRGVRIACILREQEDEVRGSFRSKDGTDVAAIAREFDGGGHKAAAGFTLHCSLEEAVERVAARVTRALR